MRAFDVRELHICLTKLFTISSFNPFGAAVKITYQVDRGKGKGQTVSRSRSIFESSGWRYPIHSKASNLSEKPSYPLSPLTNSSIGVLSPRFDGTEFRLCEIPSLITY